MSIFLSIWLAITPISLPTCGKKIEVVSHVISALLCFAGLLFLC